MFFLRTFPALVLLSSAWSAASKTPAPRSVTYAVWRSTCWGFSKASHVRNRTSFLAGPSSNATCHISSSSSRDGVSAEREDSSGLSSSGRGPNSNVSRSGNRSSRSRSCFGAYGWSNLMAETASVSGARRVWDVTTRRTYCLAEGAQRGSTAHPAPQRRSTAATARGSRRHRVPMSHRPWRCRHGVGSCGGV
jgi:hypothetical protein